MRLLTAVPVLALLAVVIITVPNGPSNAADYHHKTSIKLWPDQMCADRSITKAVLKRFNWAQKRTFGRDLRMEEILEPGEYAFRAKEPAFHDRRYCRGVAALSNGQHRNIYYRISYDRAPPLWSALEFCVIGYDYFRAYAADCRQLRPH